ncbi:ribonuclease T2 [Mesorhizobium sp. DCY119]|uniref:ribonuclease T2 family protein n=1 Tax=Mesorhizobium sp. DCY119 TaxID=2108445 RepID=UPI000E6BC4A5|nr:ribonuclease T2 [Mesorhizobium sp. DCY119]RJG45748.1 ribonuclease [Mesorhizobium sp. DCY119]
MSWARERRWRFGAAVLGLAALVAVAGCKPSGDSQQAANAPASTQAPTTTQPAVALGKGFDFYVLSLSWSPSYCEAEGGEANRQQCAMGRPYAFVVHGLWPQYERGYPQDCRTNQPDVPNDTLRTLYDIMPASGLIRHEWRKHGSCAGLSQDNYFKVLRQARERVKIPAEFNRLDGYRTLDPDDAERAFLQANQSLPADGIAVTCDRRYLREVRICMNKDLSFRSCDEVDRDSCRRDKVVMPPVRGG